MEGQNVIIKKVKKANHEAHHGGGWKVAYADFMTAMMAFFLLLWLITMVAPEKRARVSNYFKHFSIFEKSGNTFLDMKKAPKVNLVGADSLEEPGAAEIALETPAAAKKTQENEKATEQVKETLTQEVALNLPELQDQILVSTFEGGVRIEMVDKEGSAMFSLGGQEISPPGKKLLKIIAESVINSKHRIAIEGHTDAYNYGTSRFSNWELSTERASAARREMERCGLPADRLVRVAGYAATEPLVKDNPFDPKNRRISILLFHDYQSGRMVPTAAAQPSLYERYLEADRIYRESLKAPGDPVNHYLFKR